MIPLVAREALDLQVVWVTATMRPTELEESGRGAGLYAVFGEEDEGFLGLVPSQACARFPHRIFADLLPEPQPRPVAAETPLEAVYHRMAAEEVEALPVLDEQGAFLGTITRPSLLTALLRREQEHLAEARRLQGRLEAEQRRLVAYSKRLEELHQAARTLISLVGQAAIERELLQEGLQALVTLLQACYGAIGILDEAGGLQQFIFTGLTPEEADRIGTLPQGRGLLGVVIRENQVLRLQDLTQDPRSAGFPPHHPPMKSLLAVPIAHQGQVYGRIYLCDKMTGEPFTEDNERLALSFARSLALVFAHARELAERKRMEEVLRESEERYRAFYEDNPSMYFTVDPEGMILSVNQFGATQLGYRVEALVGQSIIHIIYENDKQAVRQHLTTCLQNPMQIHHGEFRKVRKDGSMVWVKEITRAMRGADGNPVVLIVCQDITDRKRMEEVLRESELWLRAIFDSLEEAVFVVTLDRRVVNMNSAAERMLGYTLEEIKYQSTERLHVDHDHYVKFGERIADAFRRGEAANFEFKMRRKSGEVFPTEHTVSLLKGDAGEPMGLVSIVRDITKRKQAEEALVAQAEREAALRAVGEALTANLQSEVIFQVIAEKAVEAAQAEKGTLFAFDPETQELRAAAWVGLSLAMRTFRLKVGEQVTGRAVLERRLIAIPDVEADTEHGIQLDVPRREGIRALLTLPLIAKGKVVGALSVYHSKPHFFSDAEIARVTLFAQPAAIALENAQLFQQVRAGRERLQTLSRQLVEVQEIERRYIARELHDEIGQVLTGLKLTLEMSTRLPADAARASLSEAQKLASDLMARVRDLSLALRPAMLDDLGLLPTLLWHFERYTAQTQVAVTFQHTGLERRFPPEVETAVYRIVQEALTNVARHAGVPEVTVRLWADQNMLGLQIEDQGTGFDPEATLAAGTSSGLAGMRERALLLGGYLTVESAPGAGTRMMAELPLGGLVERRKKHR